METLTQKPLKRLKVASQARQHFDEAELRQLGESLKVEQPQSISSCAVKLLGIGRQNVADEIRNRRQPKVLQSRHSLAAESLLLSQWPKHLSFY